MQFLENNSKILNLLEIANFSLSIPIRPWYLWRIMRSPAPRRTLNTPARTFGGVKSGGSPPRIFLNLADDHYPPCPTFF